MKNILVTGGAGFIGSHTVVELKAAGYTPVIIDDLSNSDERVIENLAKILGEPVAFYKHDYKDKEFLTKLIATEKINGVIHFAAYKAVAESVENPLKYYDNNVSGLVGLLSVLEEHNKVPSLVFSSSCTVYGEPDTLPVSEEAPFKPATSPYGTTKQFCETIIKDCSRATHSMKSIALRYFNPIGAHSSGLIGELPKGTPSNLIPYVTQTVAGIRNKLTVHGNDYPTPDGTCIRDYIHVVDLAKAHVKALATLENQRPGYYDVFNIGTGHGSSVLEVVAAFEKVNHKKVAYEIGPRRTGDIIAMYASAAKANSILGWKSEKNLEDALRDAWLWQESLGIAK